MADRTPVFELHILPMFRAIDHLHMLAIDTQLDLWSYDSVKARAADIAAVAATDMPSMPARNTGGYWPQEWRTLFNRWMTTGYRRLAQPTASKLKLTTSDIETAVACTVSVPNAPDATAWFDIVDGDPANRVYRVLVFEGEAYPPPAATATRNIKEKMDLAVAQKGITVIDAAGAHKLSL
jgi:hypothetical protein